jgi:hypothetical protein
MRLNQTEDVDFILSIHSISSISFSIFSVIRLSTSSGLTPGYGVAIEIIPNFISGVDSFGIEIIEKIPTRTMRKSNKKETL